MCYVHGIALSLTGLCCRKIICDKVKMCVKVIPYTFVRKGVPVRKDTYPEPSAYEVGWPVPFLAAFISPVFPLGTHLLLGEQWVSIQSRHQVELEP